VARFKATETEELPIPGTVLSVLLPTNALPLKSRMEIRHAHKHHKYHQENLQEIHQHSTHPLS